MIRNTIGMAMLAAALIVGLPVWADYETGQRAWDAGHLEEALTQWRAAADAGDRRAMLALGQRYRQGLGVLQDYVEAHVWFNLAASRGEAAALDERDAVAAKMTPAQISAAQQRAAAWRPGASPGGSAPATPTPSAMASASEEDSPPPRAIRDAQTLLGALGYRAGAPDGIWGTRTAQAYRAFLLDAGLPVVDILTPDALRALRAHAHQREGVPAKRARDAALPPDALHHAAQAGDIDALEATIAAGADVNARDARGWTALMHAANKGYTLLVPILIEAKAEVDIRAPDGATALFIAAVHGHAEVFARLMHAGADASIAGPQGRTPVEVAQLRDHSRLLAVPEVVALIQAEAERKEREEAERRAEADSGAFSIAKSRDTPQAYKDYLSEWCPGGNFCSAVRTRFDQSVRERIAGRTFSGPLLDGQLTLQFSASDVFKIHLLGGSVPSGTWRVDGGKVLMNYSEFFGVYRISGEAELDGDVLVGHFDWKDGRLSWRLSERPAENTGAKRRVVDDTNDFGGQ